MSSDRYDIPEDVAIVWVYISLGKWIVQAGLCVIFSSKQFTWSLLGSSKY